MIKENLLNQTLKSLTRLPGEKIASVLEYTEFLAQKYEEEVLNRGLKEITDKSRTYDFLKDEEDLYTVNDLKEKYK